MRFDTYLEERGISAAPVDRFYGIEVDVDGPPDWEAVESRPGMRIWIWPDDPYRQQFCGNAVLTMHRISTVLDPLEVFEMLCNEQVHLVGGCHERYRAWRPAVDGVGIDGMLSSQFDSQVGSIGSASQSRIIAPGQETLIAQLTVTALLGSPANSANIRLTVKCAGAAAAVGEPDGQQPVAGGIPASRVVGGAL